MPIELSAAAVAQQVAAKLRALPYVTAVYGPLLQRPGQFFMRFEYEDGSTFALELNEEAGE